MRPFDLASDKASSRRPSNWANCRHFRASVKDLIGGVATFFSDSYSVITLSKTKPNHADLILGGRFIGVKNNRKPSSG